MGEVKPDELLNREAFDANFRLGPEELWRHVNVCVRVGITALEADLAEARETQHVHPSCDATCPNYGPDAVKHLATVTAKRDELKEALGPDCVCRAIACQAAECCVDQLEQELTWKKDRITALEALLEAALFLRSHHKKPGDWERLCEPIAALGKGTVEGALAYLSSLPKNQPAEGDKWAVTDEERKVLAENDPWKPNPAEGGRDA